MTAHSSSFRGLIFDLDGTLIDSAPDIASAVNSFFLSRGWPQQETTFIERFIGNGPRRLLLDIMIELGLPHDVATVDAAVLAYIENYTRYPARYTRFYKHVKEDLQTLREAGFELGICTNKPHALTERVLDPLGVSAVFSAVLGADVVAACKPDPRHLIAVADKMGLTTEAYAYVGDTEVDLATAAGTGVTFFAVPWGSGKTLLVKPAHRLERLADLMAYRPDAGGEN